MSAASFSQHSRDPSKPDRRVSFDNDKITAGGLLRRRTASRGNVFDEAKPKESALLRGLKGMDVYARVDDELRVKTDTGATVTVVFWVLLVLLVMTELWAYLGADGHKEHLMVDTTLGQRLRINLDMTFHSIPCLDLHVDAMDVAGENQLDVEHDMLKQRLDSRGNKIGEAIPEAISVMEHQSKLPADYCGSCYGAEEGPSGAREFSGGTRACCNTCKELTEAYSRKGWTTHEITRTAEQCVREKHLERALEPGEGCNLKGFMSVNKVAGNFHMAMGESMMKDGRHIHQFSIEDAHTFNVSHTINQLSFGEPCPGTKGNPLDSTVRMVDEDVGTGLFQYFMQLVPTVYRDGKRETVTSQFAYTMKFRSIYGYQDYHHDPSTPHHHGAHGEHTDSQGGPPIQYLLPGVFFIYDISPFMVEVSKTSTPFSHLLIRLCAIAGGVFTVSGMVDKAVFYLLNRVKRGGLLG